MSEKRAQLGLGLEGDAREPRRWKSWGKGDESCQCRSYRTGELRRRGGDRTANAIADGRELKEPQHDQALTAPQA